jgi:hypothetical protein
MIAISKIAIEHLVSEAAKMPRGECFTLPPQSEMRSLCGSGKSLSPARA